MGVGSTLESLVLLYNKRGRASDLWSFPLGPNRSFFLHSGEM